MSTDKRNPRVKKLAAQLQDSLEKRGARLPVGSPEAKALEILRDALFEEDKPAPGVPRSPLHAWLISARLGEQAVFFLAQPTVHIAAKKYGKKVITAAGAFVYGGSVNSLELTQGLLVTVVQDEKGNVLQGSGDTGDGQPGRSQAGVQTESTEDAS